MKKELLYLSLGESGKHETFHRVALSVPASDMPLLHWQTEGNLAALQAGENSGGDDVGKKLLAARIIEARHTERGIKIQFFGVSGVENASFTFNQYKDLSAMAETLKALMQVNSITPEQLVSTIQAVTEYRSLSLPFALAPTLQEQKKFSDGTLLEEMAGGRRPAQDILKDINCGMEMLTCFHAALNADALTKESVTAIMTPPAKTVPR